MKITDRVNLLVKNFETRNPFDICNGLGVVVLRPRLLGVRGFFIQEDGVSIVNVSCDLPDHAARFVCAHELGHSQMHKGVNRLFLDRCTYELPSRYENEADKFACHLLFGEPPLFQEDLLTDKEIAAALNVPTNIVMQRLFELGIRH